jgi:hypothetical protein
MKNASTGKTSLTNQTDWTRIRAMKDEAITFDENCPGTNPEDWDNAIVNRSLPEFHEKVTARAPGAGKSRLKKYPYRYATVLRLLSISSLPVKAGKRARMKRLRSGFRRI